MMISTSKNAIFIAGIKKGSTSIENALASDFEIRVTETPIGKHMPYMTMTQYFWWLFEQRPIENFFVFGVMRDPVDWFISLYNFHSGIGFSDRPLLSTQGMSIDDFITVWRRHNSWQMRPQYQMFIGNENNIMVDFLLDFNKLQKHMDFVSFYLNLSAGSLTCDNKSSGAINRSDLTDRHIDWILRVYSQDLNIYHNRVGKLLRSNKINHRLSG